MVEVRWDNYSAEDAPEGICGKTEYSGESMQITFDAIRTENGDDIARWDAAKDRWVRLSDGTEWTDVAW